MRRTFSCRENERRASAGSRAKLQAPRLFKPGIRERALSGRPVAPGLRIPTLPETDACRGHAERILDQYARSAIDEVAPKIERRARDDAQDTIIAATRLGAWPRGARRPPIGPALASVAFRV
jgi:hypothetical protein